MTAERQSATKRRRLKSLARGASVGRLGSDFAEQAGVAHLADEIKGMNVRAQPDIDATCQIAGEVMQVHAPPRQRHRAVGHIGVRCGNALEITPIRVVGLRVATDHDAVAKRGPWTEEAGLIEEFYG